MARFSTHDPITENFRDQFDRLLFKQQHIFGDRTLPLDYPNRNVIQVKWQQSHDRDVRFTKYRGTNPINQHTYNLEKVFPVHIAADLIHYNWGNDSFMDEELRDVLKCMIDSLIEDYPDESADALRVKLCNLLARLSRIHLNPNPSQHAFMVYSSHIVSSFDPFEVPDQEPDKPEIQPPGDGESAPAAELDANQWFWECCAMVAAIGDLEMLKRFFEEEEDYLSECGKKRFLLAENLRYDEEGRDLTKRHPDFGTYLTSSWTRRNFRRMLWDEETESRGTPIENAAICGRVENLTFLLERLEQVSDVLLQDHAQRLRRALELASEYGYAKVVELIMDFAMRHNISMAHKGAGLRTTAFDLACMNNHLTVAKLLEPLIPQWTSSRSLQAFLNSVLCSCVAIGSKISTIRYLIGYGAQPNGYAFNIVDRLEQTPLTLAVRYGRRNLVKALVELGADPSQADLWRFCYWSIARDDHEFLNMIIDLGIEPYHDLEDLLRHHESDMAILPIAAVWNSISVVQLMQNRRPQVFEDGQAQIALCFTCDHPGTKMARLLLENGTDVKGEHATFAVFNATKEGNKELVKLLLEQGANPNLLRNYAFPETMELRPVTEFRKRQEYYYETREMSPLAFAEHQIALALRDSCSIDDGKDFASIADLLRSHGAESICGTLHVSIHHIQMLLSRSLTHLSTIALTSRATC